MDKEFINKVVEDIFVEGMSKLQIKTEVYKRLDKELKGEDRVHLKILEYEIQQLEDDEMEFTDYIVKGMNEYDSNKTLQITMKRTSVVKVVMMMERKTTKLRLIYFTIEIGSFGNYDKNIYQDQ